MICVGCNGTGKVIQIIGKDFTGENADQPTECNVCEGRGSFADVISNIFGEPRDRDDDHWEHA